MTAGPGTATRKKSQIPSLHGIRAVAVLIVFIGHSFTAPGIWPGHVGVTIFFFLSGYLITTLLRREHQRTGRISLGKFYLRRLLRITPPALIAIALCVAAGVLWMPTAMSGLGIAAEVFNFTNYYMAAVGGHDGLPPESSMLWSLAVEEHFYLLFPALFILLLRRRMNYRRVGVVLLAAAAVAPLWRIFLYLADAGFYRLYTSTDTRFDGLLVGAAMALMFNPDMGDAAPLGLSDTRLKKVVAPIAVVVFAALSILPDVLRLTVVDTVLYACLVPIFWVLIKAPEGLAGRVLNHRWVQHIGELSFSLYLVHRLALGTADLFIDSAPVTDLVALIISLGAAQLIYMSVEEPLSRVRARLEASMPAKRPSTVDAK